MIHRQKYDSKASAKGLCLFGQPTYVISESKSQKEISTLIEELHKSNVTPAVQKSAHGFHDSEHDILVPN